MPKKLPYNVKQSLEKSRDSVILAVETYNKPAVKFKSGAYVVLMNIAWTSLFHAIFFKKKMKPFYKKKDNPRRYDKKDGDYCYWELQTCIKIYFEHNVEDPIRKNIELFIPLRNRIEHKSLPAIDPIIFAECQSLLLNYDKILEKEFGINYCIRECLSFSLQLFSSSKNLVEAIKSNKDAIAIKDFIDSYRSSLSTNVFESSEYSFKAFLIQVKNHKSADTLPIQFIAYDKLSPGEQHNVDRVVTLIKEKYVGNDNKELMLPKEVVKKVQSGLGDIKRVDGKDVFNQYIHTLYWKKHKVRPYNGDPNPEKTQIEYCEYNSLNKCYGYTQKWVTFLIEEYKKEQEIR